MPTACASRHRDACTAGRLGGLIDVGCALRRACHGYVPFNVSITVVPTIFYTIYACVCHRDSRVNNREFVIHPYVFEDVGLKSRYWRTARRFDRGKANWGLSRI